MWDEGARSEGMSEEKSKEQVARSEERSKEQCGTKEQGVGE
jgi:hypothetical protein